MNSQLQQLIDAVKSAAPALWAAAQQQVTAEIVTGIVGAVIALVVSVGMIQVVRLTVRKLHACHDRYDKTDWQMAVGFTCVGAALPGFWALACIFTTLPILLAPQYNAIQQLTNLSPVK